MKIAVVSDRNSYSLQLTAAISKIPDVTCLFYGPKKIPLGRVIQFKGFKNDEPVWTTYGYMWQIFLQAFKDKPQIVHFDYTLTIFGNSYANSAFLIPLILMLRLINCKVVVTVHDTVTQQVLNDIYQKNIFKKQIFLLLSSLFYRLLSLANILIVHLNYQKRILMNKWSITGEKIFVVPFGVGLKPVISKLKIADLEKKFCNNVILFFGHIAPRKGLEYLIEGFSFLVKKRSDSCLMIVGGADNRNKKYLKKLMNLADMRIPKSKFFYVGRVSEEEAHALFRISTAVVLPYIYAHASPSVLYWAIQNNKPVVVTDMPTFVEELKGYPKLLFVKPQNSKQISNALDLLLSRKDLLNKAQKFMVEKADLISWTRTSEELEKIYQSLFKQNRKQE